MPASIGQFEALPKGRRRLARLACAIVVLACPAAAACGGEWPQILGPHRNGIADDEHLADSLPAAGPPVRWQRAVGSGFAGPAVSRGRLVLFHREADEARAVALDAATGKELWRVGFPTNYAKGFVSDDGPRCVPLIHKDRVYLFGADGDLHCVAFDTGQVRWSRQLYREYGAPEGYFGAGSTPIVAGDKLLVNVGGRGAGIVALALTDGSTLWKATDELASYSSPVAATIDGRSQVVFVTRLNVVSVDPDNGSVLCRFPFGMRGPTVNAANPIVIGDDVFVTANYGVGAELARIGPGGAKRVWAAADVLSSQYTTGVFDGGTLFGIDGRQDMGVARLRAIDPLAGRVLWTEENFGTATLILAGKELLVMKTDGTLVLAEANPKKYRQLASAQILPTTVQALPALADGLFYARDTRTLKCVDLRAK
jgi:outer membrane protein assembly factor BamB